MEIIRDSKKLNAFIQSTMRMYASSGERIHCAVVSAMFQTAAPDSGNPKPLTVIYHGLRSNDQTALKNFIRRVHIAVGLGLDHVPEKDEHGNLFPQTYFNQAVTEGAVFDFKDKEFNILPGRMKQRKALCDLVEKLAEPDEKKGWRKVLDRNNFAELRIFGDEQVFEGIARLVKQSEGSERSVSRVSEPVKRMLTQLATQAQQLRESGQLSTPNPQIEAQPEEAQPTQKEEKPRRRRSTPQAEATLQ